MIKPLAKSLHTHSVLVNLGLHLWRQNKAATTQLSPAKAACVLIGIALEILELKDKEDPYGLADRAEEHLAEHIAAARKGQ